MRSGWRVGSIFGIPLLIDTSWLFILGLVTVIYAIEFTDRWSYSAAWIGGFVTAVLLFTSVLLHELGHSLVARWQGIRVNSITLFMLGGIASIERESKTPGQAFQVAIAGPMVSLVLFLVLHGLDRILPNALMASAIVKNLAAMNLLLALFNMIPGLPLDGGQVLKATIWKLTGSRLTGVRWASRFGQGLGWFAILFGFMGFLSSLNFNFIWIVFLGWFGLRNALAYSRVTDLQEAILGLNAAAAMSLDYRVVDANLTVRQFTDKYILFEESLPPAFYATSDGRYRGMVNTSDLRDLERSEWDVKTLHDIVHPLPDIPRVLEASPLAAVIGRLETEGLNRITVLSPAGAVAGTIDRGDIVRAIASRLKVPLPDATIKRIKEDGVYPPGLQISEIAQSVLELGLSPVPASDDAGTPQ